MLLFPNKKHHFTTQLSIAQVKKILGENMAPLQIFGTVESDQPFHGRMNDNHFKMFQVKEQSHPFIPIIKGEILEESGNTQINVKMRMVRFFIFFFCVVYLVLLFGIFRMIQTLEAESDDVVSMLIIWSLCAISLRFLMHFLFYRESDQVSQMLNDLLRTK